jgi:hypothetical protein
MPGPVCLAAIQFSNWETVTKIAVGFVTISYYAWKWRTDYLDRKERKLKEAKMTAGAKKWAHGLIGGFVGGAAGALDSSLALMVIVPKEFNLGPGLKQTLQTAAVLGFVNGGEVRFCVSEAIALTGRRRR